jgi:hypothetical protein
VTIAEPAASAAPEPEASPAFYKRWWFWTLAGAVVAGAVAVGVASATRGEVGRCPGDVTDCVRVGR